MKSYEYYYLAKRNLLPDSHMRDRVKGSLKGKKRIHISAVCGKAMASIACMLAESGFEVTGSDTAFHPPMSDVLKSHNIKCLEPSIENVKNIDLLIVGNTLSANFPEVVSAKENNIPMLSGSEVVAELFEGKRSLVVAGTHGKTTTSSLLAHVYMRTRKNPSYMIGGVFHDSGDSYSIGKKDGTHSIYEGDEYDCAFFDKAPKFLRYNPTSAIITSIEHDHIDLYPTFTDYKQAFQFLADDIPAQGFLIIHESAVANLNLTECASPILIYGNSNSVDVWYTVDSVDSDGTNFSIHTKEGKTYSNIFIPLFGEYNVLNAVSVFTLSLFEGLSSIEITEAFASYPGVRERQEVLGVKDGNIEVVRDFAHHPTAVLVTLEGLRSHYPGRRLVCVFEPRSVTSRRKMFETEYPKSLSGADISVVVTPPFKENDNRSNFMDVSVVKKIMEEQGKIVYTVENPEDALSVLKDITKSNDVVVFMSNGDFGDIPNKFLHS